ncbi:hypothetical protein CFK37_14700 [Virgibacillus phasianinus]|uniref:Uncharacterized protein n=1 Tax=Virgibacillus phasianinus TaxID=2017483 RepID=A0A220U5J7_9BACI|nr:hypothetical protein [Virgibacillus phasianinus]ASK63315.1 hypothetical protein CFK37_14700 [Virgibacillus phasianinus]
MTEKNTAEEEQANDLHKLFNEIQGNENENNRSSDAENNGEPKKTEPTDRINKNSEFTRDIDILNLPPRKEVHGNRKNHTRIKISKPFVRFSVVIILLILVFLVVYYFWQEELIQLSMNL